jgi:hypothetical protein
MSLNAIVMINCVYLLNVLSICLSIGKEMATQQQKSIKLTLLIAMKIIDCMMNATSNLSLYYYWAQN